MNPIRVVIVDDHPIIRQGVRNVLAYHSDIHVIGEAESGAYLYRNLEAFSADVVLLDIRMPGESGIEIVQRLKKRPNPVKVIMLTTYEEEEYLLEAVKAGAEGYLLKTSSPNVLADAIRRVAGGELLVSPDLMDSVLREFQEMSNKHVKKNSALDDKELEIIKLIADGSTNREIAKEMFFSEATAKRKVQEIFAKLGASNRTQAAAEAARRGLV